MNLLLIYDNIDEIEKDKIAFKWHLSLLMNSQHNVKIITTRCETPYQLEEMTQNLIFLEALST